MASPRGGDGRGQAFPRGGKVGGRGRKGGSSKSILPRRKLPGVFKGTEGTLFTKNMIIGDSVYGEKRTTVIEDGEKIEYRQWDPSCKLAAAICCGVGQIYMSTGSKVLYLGAASVTTVSHVSDIVGPEGLVYAVAAPCPGRDLIVLAQKRTNIVPIIEDARFPFKYSMLIQMVDTIFADVAQPDQAHIVDLNAQLFLRDEGHFFILIKANCIDSKGVFSREVKKMKEQGMKVEKQLQLERYHRGYLAVVGNPSPPTEK